MIPLFHYWAYIEVNKMSMFKRFLLSHILQPRYGISVSIHQHRWIKKTCIYTQPNTSWEQRERNPVIDVTCINLENIILIEINQARKDKYHMISFIWRIFKKFILQKKSTPVVTSGGGHQEVVRRSIGERAFHLDRSKTCKGPPVFHSD